MKLDGSFESANKNRKNKEEPAPTWPQVVSGLVEHKRKELEAERLAEKGGDSLSKKDMRKINQELEVYEKDATWGTFPDKKDKRRAKH